MKHEIGMLDTYRILCENKCGIRSILYKILASSQMDPPIAADSSLHHCLMYWHLLTRYFVSWHFSEGSREAEWVFNRIEAKTALPMYNQDDDIAVDVAESHNIIFNQHWLVATSKVGYYFLLLLKQVCAVLSSLPAYSFIIHLEVTNNKCTKIKAFAQGPS